VRVEIDDRVVHVERGHRPGAVLSVRHPIADEGERGWGGP
jgi:hypothetical protein